MSLASRHRLKCISDATNVLGILAFWQIDEQFVGMVQKTRIRCGRPSGQLCGAIPAGRSTGKENPVSSRRRRTDRTRRWPASLTYPKSRATATGCRAPWRDDHHRKCGREWVTVSVGRRIIDVDATGDRSAGISCAPGDRERSTREQISRSSEALEQICGFRDAVRRSGHPGRQCACPHRIVRRQDQTQIRHQRFTVGRREPP